MRDNTIVVVPGANGLVDAGGRRHRRPCRPAMFWSASSKSRLRRSRPSSARGRAAGARTILNPAPVVAFDRALLDLVDILVLNETELGVLTGADVGEDDPPARLIDARARPAARARTRSICVTLGKRGAIALVDGDAIAIAGRAVTAVDTTGAGDCFVGALAARLADGAAIRDCAGVRQRRGIDLRSAAWAPARRCRGATR